MRPPSLVLIQAGSNKGGEARAGCRRRVYAVLLLGGVFAVPPRPEVLTHFPTVSVQGFQLVRAQLVHAQLVQVEISPTVEGASDLVYLALKFNAVNSFWCHSGLRLGVT